MDAYYTISTWSVVFILFVQMIMLTLQAAALKRHGHVAFLLLCIGSVCGVLYAVLSVCPYFFVVSDLSAWRMFLASMALVFAGALFGVVGTALLFRSYRKLSQVAASSGGA